jgi:predicted transcriptional regulator
MRRRLGLTQAEVARRMQVRQERVSAIEHAKVDVSELRTLSAYINALGGRMEVIADFGGERLVVG